MDSKTIYIDKLKELAKENISLNEIAKRLGVSRGKVTKDILMHGIDRKSLRPSNKEKITIDYCLSKAKECSSIEEFKYKHYGLYRWGILRNPNLFNFLESTNIRNFPEFALKIICSNLWPNDEIRYNDRLRIHPKELDVYNYTKNIAIEYDGKNFHTYENDKEKDDICKRENIFLIRIKEKEKNKNAQIDNIFDTLCTHFNFNFNREELKHHIILKSLQIDYDQKLDIDNIEKIIDKYDSVKDFKRDYPKLYSYVIKENEKILWVFPDFRKNLDLYTEDEIKNILYDCKDKSEFVKHQSRAYYALLKNKENFYSLWEEYKSYNVPENSKYNKNREVTLYFLHMATNVKFYSDRYVELIEQGWCRNITPERRSYVASQLNKNRDKTLKDKFSKSTKGRKMSDDKKKELSNLIKNIQKVECQYCGLQFSPGMYSRWHGENCKHKV